MNFPLIAALAILQSFWYIHFHLEYIFSLYLKLLAFL
jgi:hypothetical protein